MELQSPQKEILEKYKLSDNDCGSTSIQIIFLTERIKKIQVHLATNKKDFHSLRGLKQLVEDRKKFLKYLIKHDSEKHQSLMKELGIRK